MGEFNIAAQSFPIWKAILWCFYPVGALVAIEYFLRLVDDDDDDDDDESIFGSYRKTKSGKDILDEYKKSFNFGSFF